MNCRRGLWTALRPDIGSGLGSHSSFAFWRRGPCPPGYTRELGDGASAALKACSSAITSDYRVAEGILPRYPLGQGGWT
jgi:hypothetical protein